MDKNTLIKELEKLEGNPVIIIRDRFGWWNTDHVKTDTPEVAAIFLAEEFSPFTSDNE